MKSYAGAAISTTITADVNSGATTIPIASSDGWGNGAGGKPFVIELRDDSGYEKVLIASRTGTTLTVATRGYDGTVARNFLAGSQIRNVWDANSATTFADHIGPNEDPDDPHSDTLLNAERHSAPGLHGFGVGEAFGVPATPSDVGTAASTGSGGDPAREDHVHKLAASTVGVGLQLVGGQLRVVTDGTSTALNGSSVEVKDGGITTVKVGALQITEPKLANDAVIARVIKDLEVTTTKLAALAVTNAKLAALAVSVDKFATGLRPVFVASTAPATPTIGDVWFDPDDKSLKIYYGATTGWQRDWYTAWGEPDYTSGTTGYQTVDQDVGASDVNLTGATVQWTAVANRRYVTHYFMGYAQQHIPSPPPSVAETNFWLCNGANTALTKWATTAANLEVYAVAIHWPEHDIVAGANTRKIRALTNAGTVHTNVDGAFPGRIWVEDVGPDGAPL